jgi:ABC-2 type transport system permease protein
MALTTFAGIIRKDLQVYFSDRRAVIMGFVVPITVASFLGSLFGGGGSREPAKIPVAIVDQDGSPITKMVVERASADATLRVTTPTAEQARDQVRRGTVSVAVIIPAGFGVASGSAMFSGRQRPELAMLRDPSHLAESGLVRGILTQHVMEAVSSQMFSSGADGTALVDRTLQDIERAPIPEERRALLRDMLQATRRLYAATPPGAPGAPGLSMPYAVREEAITSGSNVEYNGYAHSFAGMGVQFLLFAMIDFGVGILLERQRGLWKRLRSAPISRLTLLSGRAVSAAAIAVVIQIVSFTFAGIVFGVRIHGSVPGFLAICVACALMAAALGLLIAALGSTPGGARGVSSLAVLLMVMLGGAWMPTFIFPAWVQRLTVVIPTRWAIDGFDAMTWRGLGFAEAVMPTLVLLGFAALFGGLAVARFTWEDA